MNNVINNTVNNTVHNSKVSNNVRINRYFIHSGVTEGNQSRLYRSGYWNAGLCLAALGNARRCYEQDSRTGTITVINANTESGKQGLVTHYVYEAGKLIHQGSTLPALRNTGKAGKGTARAVSAPAIQPTVSLASTAVQ